MENSIEINRKLLLKRQTKLRKIMMSFDRHEEAMALFFHQHAQVHAAEISGNPLWSFADAVLNDLTEARFKRIPQNRDHSIAWCIWHIARIEDATMNLLVAGEEQVFNRGRWDAKLKVEAQHTGNGMSDEAIAQFSKDIDVGALRAYRNAVGRQTRQIAGQLVPDQLKEKVKPARIKRLLDEGVLLEEGRGLADYWGNRTIAGLLLMPATRHNLNHLNESLKLRKKLN